MGLRSRAELPGGPAVDRRWASSGPVVAAVLSVAVVVIVVVGAGSGGRVGPNPPRPAPPPVSLDLGGQSLDRCALALGASGLTGSYPDRGEWHPTAVLFTGDTFVTLVGGAVPFVCVTGPRTVEVSDPGAAVPVDTASLLLTTAGGILAALAPAGETVDVAVPGTDPPAVNGGRYLLRVTGTPITSPGQLAVTVEGPAGTRVPGPPDRLAPPALHLTDRPWEPGDGPTSTDDLLHHCQSAQSGAEPVRQWQTAHVLAQRGGDHTAVLLVAISTGIVGGCTVGPDGATPLRAWKVGLVSDGPRPFTWLPRPGETLPDVGSDVAAGPVMPSVARIEVRDGTGRRWEASVVGPTFATHIPAGVATDPRNLTVRAFDADNRVVYDGPAAG